MNYQSRITRVTLKKEQIEVRAEVSVTNEEAVYLVLSEVSTVDASSREFAREIIPERGTIKKRIRCPRDFKIGANTRIKAHIENAANERQSKSVYIEKDYIKSLRNSLIFFILCVMALISWLSIPKPLTIKIKSAYFKDHRTIYVDGNITSKQKTKDIKDLKLQLLHEGKIKFTQKIASKYFTFNFPYSLKKITDLFEVQLVYDGKVMEQLTTKIIFPNYPIVQMEKAWLDTTDKIHVRIHAYNVKKVKIHIVEHQSKKNIGTIDVATNGESTSVYDIKNRSSKRYGVYISTSRGNTPLKWVEYTYPQGTIKKAFFTTARNCIVRGVWFGPKNASVLLQIKSANKILAESSVAYGSFSKVFTLSKPINGNQQYLARLISGKNTLNSSVVKMRSEFKKLVKLKKKGIDEITRQLDLILYGFYKKQKPMENLLRRWYSLYQESYRRAISTRRLKGHERESELLREYLRQLKLTQKDLENFLEDVAPVSKKWFDLAKIKNPVKLRQKKEKLSKEISQQISRSRFLVILNMRRIEKMAKIAKRLNSKGKVLPYTKEILTWAQGFLK